MTPSRFSQFQQSLVSITERTLTKRRRKLARREAKHQKQNRVVRHVLEWLNAFAFAIIVVFFLNQYALQAYTVPTGSMKPTVDEGDRLFFDKLTFGPELLPGFAKLPGMKKPKRNDIIIFENPTYISRGPAFNVVSRILYMMSFSLINIDRNEAGDPRNQYLLKRAVGMGGDVVTTDMETGELHIKPAGSIDPGPLHSARFYGASSYTPVRQIKSEAYPLIKSNARASVASHPNFGLPGNTFGESGGARLNPLVYASDVYEYWQFEALHALFPASNAYRSEIQKHHNGIYIPEGDLLPIGDNRDDSSDGRYFGSIDSDAVLGKPIFRYWPLDRSGGVR